MRRLPPIRTTAVASAVMLALAACTDDPTSVRTPGATPRGAVAGQSFYTPPVVDGVYLLAKACDVMIGRDPLATAVPAGATEFQHQLIVDVPTGATIKLVRPSEVPGGDPGFPAGVVPDVMLDATTGTPSETGTVFGCDATDTDPAVAPGTAVVDPITAHAAKGNGPTLNTSGVTFDLNGYGITSHVDAGSLIQPPGSPTGELLDNIGVVVGGEGQTVTNSSDATSRVTKFAHNIDIGGNNVTVRGRDLDAEAPGIQYNLEAQSVSAVLAGNVTIEKVRMVDTTTVEPGTTVLIGTGFEARRCTGLTTVRDSDINGSGDAVFIRECSNVVLERNTMTSQLGHGVGIRQVSLSTSRPIIIRDNTISGTGLDAIDFGYDEGRRANATGDALRITGNNISDYARDPAAVGQCGIANTSGTLASLPTDGALMAANAIAVVNGKLQTCGFPAGPPPNQAPIANANGPYTVVAGGTVTFSAAGSSDPENGALSYLWTFHDGSASTLAAPAKQYTTAGSFSVTLEVQDPAGARTTATTTVEVTAPTNAAPTAVIAGAPGGNEGAAIAFSSTGSSDPESSALTYAWTFGDGFSSSLANPSHSYADNGTYTVTLIVTDAAGLASPVASKSVTIANVAPTATSWTRPTSITEGTSFTIRINGATDISSADRAAGLRYEFDCGNGIFLAPRTTNSVTCAGTRYPDQQAPVVLRAKVTDKDGGVRSYNVATMTTTPVVNAAPVTRLRALSGTAEVTSRTATVGQNVSFRLSFTDAGVNDGPWTYVINWGDGTPTTTGTILPGTTGRITRTHAFAATGAKTVRATVRDKDGAVGTSGAVTITVQ